MALPLGPPSPAQPPAFRSLATTPPAQAPSLGGSAALRPPGSAYRLHSVMAGISDQPYEPPAWAKQILTVDPLTAASAGSPAAAASSGYQRPGLPERININPFGSDPIGQFLGGDAGVAAGLVPGQQRGGTYHGIATTPLTLANASTWGRERVLALLTSLMGRDYQQPESAAFGAQPEAVKESDTLDKAIVNGLAGAGDLLWKALDAPMTWVRNSNNFNRGKSVRDLFAKGDVTPFVIEMVTSGIFGGSDRFTIEGMRAAAGRQGIDVIDAIAKAYDLPADVVAAIAQNPYMGDDELGTYTDGQAMSVDPITNLGLELVMQGAMLAVGGAGVAKGAATLARAGLAPGSFALGLRGGQIAEGASAAARASRTAGYLGRKALQLNAANTTVGWTIGGAEWGIKQLAAIAGDDALVTAMDRLMWQMPLAMNPGWNLVDGFSSHPITAVRNLRQGQVAIGRRGTPGYVGQLDLRGLALREGDTGQVMTMRVGGREIKLGRGSEEFKVLGRLRDLTPDDMHAQFFSRLDWSRESLETAFGEGNRYDLTWDDARNALFTVALNAVREGKGQLGRLEGLEHATMAERSAAFVRDNARGAFKVLDDALTGRSTAMADQFRGSFWDLAARNDSSIADIKAHLGEYDPNTALIDFLSWVRASKVVRSAMERGVAARDAVPVFRRDVNREFVGRWLASIGERFGPDEVVPTPVINQLKRYGGAVEMRGRGGQLVRGRQIQYTRKQLEEIVADVLRVDDETVRRAGTVPRAEAAAYRRGVDPGQDPLEDARVLDISVTMLGAIRTEQARPVHASLPPTRLVQQVAREMDPPMTADGIMRLGPDGAWRAVFDWLEAKSAGAVETREMRDALDGLGTALAARVADGRMDAGKVAPMVAALGRIRDEMLNPLDKRLAERRPGLHAHWQETAQVARVLSQEIIRHLDAAQNPELGWRSVEVAPGQWHVLPATVNGALLKSYQSLVTRVLGQASPFLGEFDRQRLADPATHPFLKGDILATAASPQDRRTLMALEQQLGGDPRGIITGMAGDAGLDPSDAAVMAATLDSRAQAYIASGEELGGRAAQLARRFQTLGGMYSDEMGDTIDRVLDIGRVWRKTSKKAIHTLPMDPEDGARRSASVASAERAVAQRKLTAAEQRLQQAERAAAGEEGRPSAFDEATMEWESARVFRKGRADAKRAEAIAHAAGIRRTTGDITSVVRRQDAAYEVLVARPRAAAPEPRVLPPPPADLTPIDTLASVRRLTDTVLASDRASVGDAMMDLDIALPVHRVADPRYAPDAIDGPVAFVRSLAERLSRDLERNPAATPHDPRQQVLAWATGVLEAHDRRIASLTGPEGVIETAMASGDTATAQAANVAVEEARGGWEAPPAGQRVDLDAMRAEEPPAPPTPLVPDGSFPDPGTQAPVPYELRVVSASSLVTSTDDGFDPALQPRMRGVRKTSDSQIESIAAGPNPALLTGVEDGSVGTPVVLTDRQVLAGNGRVAGLRGAYADGTAADYAAAVGAAEGIPDPVLVRVIDVPREDAIRLAFQLNLATGLPPADMAMGLSRLLTAEDIQKLSIGTSQSLGEAIKSGTNDGFVSAVLSHIPTQFRQHLFEADGKTLNAAAIDTIAASLFARFTDATNSLAGQILLGTLFENADVSVKSLASGMDAIGALIQSQIESVDRPWGGVAPAFAADIVPALQRVFDLRSVKSNMQDVIDILDGATLDLESVDLVDLTPTQQALARNLALMAQQGGGGAEGLRRLLRNVARRVRGHDEAAVEAMPMDLFGGADAQPDPSYPGVVNEAFVAMNLTRPEGRQFALLPDPDGITHVRDLSGAETARLHPVVDDAHAVIEGLAPTGGDVVLEGGNWADHARTIPRFTGRVVVRADTQAEADILTAFLAGNGKPLPPEYRVVDGAIEPLGRKRANPGLVALRDSLADRDFEVQVGRATLPEGPLFYHGTGRAEGTRSVVGIEEWDRNFFVTHDPTIAALYGPDVREVRLRPGARVVTLGDPEFAALQSEARGVVKSGRLLDEAVEMVRLARERGIDMVDFRKDYIGAVVVNEDAVVSGGRSAIPDARPTEIVSAAARDIDPDFERVTGLSPLRADADSDAVAAAASGAHRLVDSADEVRASASQRAAGAPVTRGRQVIETNAPDPGDRMRLAQEAREAAALEVEGARKRLEDLGPDTEGPPPREVLSGSELDLYHRYIASSSAPGQPTRQPRSVGEVMDLLASLDIGLPPLVGTMTDVEMNTLRTSLLRTLNARLDALGIDPSKGPARRAGPGGRRHAPTVGTRVDEPPSVTTPDDLSADLAEVVRTLQGRVWEADDALAGWEGTQYEIGLPPSKATDATGPLAPRIPAGEDWIGRMDELVPGLGEELLHGRKRAWPERVEDARWANALRHTPAGWMMTRLSALGDTAFGSRPERDIVAQSVSRFEADVLRHFTGDAAELGQAKAQVHEMIGAVHDRMAIVKFGPPKMRMQIWRRVGLVDPEDFEAASLSVFQGAEPEWMARFLAEGRAKGLKHPLAEAWRENDNRIRAYFSEQGGSIAKYLERVYDSQAGRAAHTIGRGTTVFYHVARFLLDLRWLGLEMIEAPTLTLFREGPGAVMEGFGKGRNAGKRPMFMGTDASPEAMRERWAWWLAQSDPGALLRTRERYILAIVRRTQEQEFPRALRQAAHDSPDLAAAIRAFDGGDEMAWLRRLDADLELGSRRGQPLDRADAERLFKPWLERGVISGKEYAEFVAARRYTGHPALDRALAESVGEPWMAPLIERLGAINEQGWNDAARLIFGQTDRSNVQRLANHPLLWWPVSYQVKATKWLADLLFDRAFGVDTGSLGAVTLGQIHQRHLDRMRTDEEYANTVTKNPTLLFVAQMLFPITPWDLGVSLSPFTRLAMSMATAPEDEGYRRNIFSVGPGYTYFNMLPNLFREQSQPDSWAQQTGGLVGDVFRAGQRIAPYSVPIKATPSSELASATMQVLDRPVSSEEIAADAERRRRLDDMRSRLDSFNGGG